jgi:hypothetical protein
MARCSHAMVICNDALLSSTSPPVAFLGPQSAILRTATMIRLIIKDVVALYPSASHFFVQKMGALPIPGMALV